MSQEQLAAVNVTHSMAQLELCCLRGQGRARSVRGCPSRASRGRTDSRFHIGPLALPHRAPPAMMMPRAVASEQRRRYSVGGKAITQSAIPPPGPPGLRVGHLLLAASNR
jgi:hypothetical protein